MASEGLVLGDGHADVDDTRAYISVTHAHEPANHEHWEQINAQVASLKENNAEVDSDDVTDGGYDDSPTLTEAEWADAIRSSITHDVTELRKQLGWLMDQGSAYIEMQFLNDLDGLVRKSADGLTLDVDGARMITDLLFDTNEYFARDSGGSYDAMCMLERVSPQLMRQLYFEHRDDGEEGFATRLKGLSVHDVQLRIVDEVYGDDREGFGYKNDPVAQEIEGYYHGDETERLMALLPEVLRSTSPLEVAQYNARIKDIMHRVLKSSDLPDDLANHYVTAAAVRLCAKADDPRTEAPGQIDRWRVKGELQATISATRRFSVGRIGELNTKLGVENVWMYSHDELEAMLKLLDGDEELIEHLKKGDVTVDFLDTGNDWNGAFTKFSSPYRKASGRTLRFEIGGPHAIYRRMALLKKHSIKPSVFVYEAHGQLGSVGYGEHNVQNFKDGSGNAIPLDRTQFGRLVRDYMQPNRGIDSEAENVGRIQVILGSCNADVPYVYNGKEYPSLAETTAKAIGEADALADVYAAPGVTTVTREDARAVFRVRDNPDDNSKRAPRKRRVSRITPERRGGTLGYPKKTLINRVELDSVSVAEGVKYA